MSSLQRERGVDAMVKRLKNKEKKKQAGTEAASNKPIYEKEWDDDIVPSLDPAKKGVKP